LSLAAFYYRYASLPPPKTFMRYFDFSLPSAEVHPTPVSKFNTFLQIVLIGGITALPLVVTGSAFDGVMQPAVYGLQWVVAGTTAWSGLSYVWLKDAVKILGEDEVLKKRQGLRGRMIIGSSFSAFLLLAVLLAGRTKKEEDEIEQVTA
jgi:cardiolipin synthase